MNVLYLIDKYIPVNLNGLIFLHLKQLSRSIKPGILTWPPNVMKLLYSILSVGILLLQLSENVKSSFETNLAKNIFWKYVRNNTKVRHDVFKLVKEYGTITCSDHKAANCLNNFFTSMFTSEPTSETPDRSNGNTL